MQASRTPQQVASAGTESQNHGATPGIWPFIAATMLSAVLCSVWLLSDVAIAPVPDRGPGAVSSELSAVDDQDVAGALTTIEGPAALLARFKARADGCSLPLAWVSVSPVAGQPGVTVRLKSGAYYSPDFKLSDSPVRIAIPYPAPYETGHGTLTALHGGGIATIALHPPWHLSAQDAITTHEVTWHPSKRCKQPDG